MKARDSGNTFIIHTNTKTDQEILKMEGTNTRPREEIRVMILGDHSLCFEHVIRAYYNLKTGRDTKFILEECETKGINTMVDKHPVNLNLRVATTRTGMSRSSMDKVRMNDYKRRMDDIDVILLCFYQNNSKTLYNVRTKYLEEIKQHFPKTPYFLCGVTIEETVDGCTTALKETINIQDRWLKRDLEVTPKLTKQTARKIKARGSVQCSVLRTLETEGDNEISFDYDLEKCKTVRTAIDKVVKYALKRQHAPCILPFKAL